MDQAALREKIGEPHPLAEKKILSELDDMAMDFIARSPMAMLSTVSPDGFADVSPRGDAPGFVKVLNSKTLLIPERSGNKLIMSLQNILANPNVALLFMIPQTDETYRVYGTAELLSDPRLEAELAARDRPDRPAEIVIKLTVTKCYLHCGKAFKRAALWHPDKWPAKHRLRFGKVIAREAGGDEELTKLVDEIVDDDYENHL